MKGRHKIGFAIYLLAAIMTTAWGLVYLFSSEMMPYHKQAIGKNWADLDRGVQVIILALMESLAPQI